MSTPKTQAAGPADPDGHASPAAPASLAGRAGPAEPASPAGPVPDAPAVVGPSRFVRVVMGPMTRVLNPAIMRLAGRRHFRMAAQIRHTGRRSGRQYVTPVGVRLAGNTFVIPLTFGNQSDWSRNIRAAGGCSIRLNGVDYLADRPEVVDRAQAGPSVRSAFGPAQRAMMRMLGIRQFLLLRRTGP
jgi:deazaflavin-dependent oxidoreductase (nitroreductase family)